MLKRYNRDKKEEVLFPENVPKSSFEAPLYCTQHGEANVSPKVTSADTVDNVSTARSSHDGHLILSLSAPPTQLVDKLGHTTAVVKRHLPLSYTVCQGGLLILIASCHIRCSPTWLLS